MKIKSKAKIGLIILLFLTMFIVITATASAGTYTYNLNTKNPQDQIYIQKYYKIAQIDYFPQQAKVTKTFEIYRTAPTPLLGGIYYPEKDFKQYVTFSWSDNGINYNSWGGNNYFGLGTQKSFKQPLYSGSSNIRFRMYVYSENSVYQSTVYAKVY